ncbi:MAG: hypothetical protein M3Y42_17180 [Actinomycetota bacterium]|nr:hypothetical protein [Actinomycetota bacterium]
MFGAVDGPVTNAALVSADPETALRMHTREELGVDSQELPSPVVAGGASLLAFSIGALHLRSATSSVAPPD